MTLLHKNTCENNYVTYVWSVYAVLDVTVCAGNPCEQNTTCLNGGTCYFQAVPNVKAKYTCDCMNGSTGDRCENGCFLEILFI